MNSRSFMFLMMVRILIFILSPILATFVFVILILMFFLLFMVPWLNMGFFFLLLVGWRNVRFGVVFELALQNLNTHSCKAVITPMSFKTINFVVIKRKILSLNYSLIKKRIKDLRLNRLLLRWPVPFLSSQCENCGFFIVSPGSMDVNILSPA